MPALALISAAAVLQFPAIPTVEVDRSISLHGAPISYHVKAGPMSIKNTDGVEEGTMFYVSYAKKGASSARPVLFAFNGGPGSASLWLHLGTIGPRRVALNDDGSIPNPPFSLADNQETWLEKSDIVMIDAPGTGFSRVPKAENNKKFFGQQADITAFTEFIRKYLSENDRWASPVYVAGESYGGLRVAGLSRSLAGVGVGVNGIISISGTFNFSTLDAGKGNDLPYIAFLPTMTATAHFHHKLGKKLQSGSVEDAVKVSEEFSIGPYAAALQKGTDLSDREQKAIATRLAELTGISEDYIERANLRISDGRFFRELLRSDRKIVGRLDSRFTSTMEDAVGEQAGEDPANSQIFTPFTSMANDYLRRELGIRTEEKYRTYGGGDSWDFEQGRYADTSEDLRAAMTENPHLRVLLCCGYYDLACPHMGMKMNVAHMGLNREQLKRIQYEFYPAGHMMYIDKGSREKLKKDVDRFIGG